MTKENELELFKVTISQIGPKTNPLIDVPPL